MILGISEIHKRIQKGKLLENLSQRELKNPEGAGIDLRIGELHGLQGAGFLGVEDRHTPKTKLLISYNPKSKKRNTANLKPGTYYIMTTMESVNIPSDILISFFPRSTLYRSGVTIFSGNAAPGYRGKFTFGIVNFGKKPFVLEMGARVAHAIFHKVEGKTNLYRGQWQDGRLTTRGKKEKQV